MLRAILNRSWGSILQNSSYTATYHPSRKLFKLDEPDMWGTAPSHGRAKSVRAARTYIQQLCADTEYSPEDLPEARVWDIRADGAR